MKIELINNIDIKDESVHYNMISEKGGKVHFAILEKEMCANDWTCPEEGKVFLKELEKYADRNGLMLTISNVINPALEHILRKVDYIDYYIRDDFIDDTMQCWKRKNDSEL